MRKFYAVAAVAALVGVVQAQSFTEGFENGPTDWNDETKETWGNASGGEALVLDSGTWWAYNNSPTVGSTGWTNKSDIFAPHSGSQHALTNFNNTSGTGLIDNFLMSPVVTLNNGDTINFWSRTATPGSPVFPDRLYLKISTNGASVDPNDFSTVLMVINEGLTDAGYPTQYTEFSATVSGLSGPMLGRFAFNYNVTDGGPTGSNSDLIGIDDVTYESVPEPATMTLLGLGALAALRRRKSRK